MLDKKIIAILTTSSNYQGLINVNGLLYRKILKEFKELYIIDLQNLILIKKKKVNKELQFKIKNLKIFRPNSSTELINFFNNKKLVGFNCLGKNFLEFKIHYVLKKINITQIWKFFLMRCVYISQVVRRLTYMRRLSNECTYIF